MSKFKFFTTVILSALLAGCASTPTKTSMLTPYEAVSKEESLREIPTSAIFIGNSFFYFNNGIHRYVNDLAKKSGIKFRSTMVTISGAGLDWHDVNSYFRPNAIASYSTSNDGKNTLKFRDKNEKLFEVAIMQDNSQGPVHPGLKPIFEKEVDKNCKIVSKHGVKPILFMSWAYEGEPWMTKELENGYVNAAARNNAIVIPAALAFEKVTKERPDIKLRIGDKRHPTIEGTYLAACTVYATLFKRSAQGIKNNAGLNEETATYLQKAAWEVVIDFYGLK